MMHSKHIKYHILLLATVLVASIINLMNGAVKIPALDVLTILFDTFQGKDSWRYIIIEYRLPKLLIALFVGASLSIAGMMMQTLFQNPMAEPYILGISSGASLGVAICILGATLLPLTLQNYMSGHAAIIFFSLLGSIVVMFLVLGIARKVQQAITLLIIGLMFSSFTSAFVSILSYLSTAEELKKFSVWNLGSLGNVTYEQLIYILPTLCFALCLAFSTNKALNSLLLGETYAQTLGVNIKKTKFIVIIATCILVAVCTAFVGPIGFIGLAVPHITKILYKTTNHFVLFIGNTFLGALLLVICDLICQLPGEHFLLPINAVTSILGAPVVIYLLLSNKRS